MFNHFIVLVLEEQALAVIEEQWSDHLVQVHPSLISRMFLNKDTKAITLKYYPKKIKAYFTSMSDAHDQAKMCLDVLVKKSRNNRNLKINRLSPNLHL